MSLTTLVEGVLPVVANIITVVGAVLWAYTKIKDACGNRHL